MSPEKKVETGTQLCGAVLPCANGIIIVPLEMYNAIKQRLEELKPQLEELTKEKDKALASAKVK